MKLCDLPIIFAGDVQFRIIHTGRSKKSGILTTHDCFLFYKDKIGANSDVKKGCSFKNKTGCTATATTISSLTKDKKVIIYF